MAVWTFLSVEVYGSRSIGIPSDLASAGWLVTGALGMLCAALVIAPTSLWTEALDISRWLYAPSAAAALVTVTAGYFLRELWRPVATITFVMVRWILQPFVQGLIVDPAKLRIGTGRFRVVIADQCSGLEGIGLMLIFGIVWLILFRAEIRLSRAWLILPAGAVLVFLLNAVRIAALLLIGDAGAKDIAAGGFHSQAGWILFSAVAFGMCSIAGRTSWIMLNARPEPAEDEYNPVAPYLLPFLAILAAAMVARAASGQFEWFYGLRLVAAGMAVWAFRDVYRRLDWTFSWFGAVLGVVVFAVWIGIDRGGASPMPKALADAAPVSRAFWIAIRAVIAVVAVPVAEELAFRGYLFRRLLQKNFDEAPFQTMRWPALIVSSVLFGFMHGSRWPAGIIAGLCFAWAMTGWKVTRRGRIGEAVFAHAIANALIAAWVLAAGRWDLW